MVFILLLVMVQFAQGQTADEIIDKHINARGGKAAITSIRSIVMEGMKQVMGTDVEFTITKVQDKLARTDFVFGGNAGYTIITQNAGWQFIPMRSTAPETMPEERVASMQHELDIAGPLVDYATKGHKVSVVGKDAVDGKDAYKLKVTLSTGKEYIYYIDMSNYLLLRSSTTVPGAGGATTEQVTDFSDYKPVDKVMFPHTINVLGSGMMAGATTYDRITLNREISEKLYLPNE